MPSVLLFDVNETLLDLSALDPAFQRAFGTADARRSWFAGLKELWLTETVLGRYDPFDALAASALDGEAARRGVRLGGADRSAILDRLTALPAHPDVDAALGRLGGAGFRLAALTNGTPDALDKQLRHAGLSDHFEDAFSVDAVRRYKPAPEPYHWACDRLGVESGNARLVAAHAWDVAGAAAAGLRTAFVARGAPRPGKGGWPDGYIVPDVVGDDLAAVADQLLETRSTAPPGRGGA